MGCPKCQAPTKPGQNFCTACGTPLAQAPVPVAPPPAAVVPPRPEPPPVPAVSPVLPPPPPVPRLETVPLPPIPKVEPVPRPPLPSLELEPPPPELETPRRASKAPLLIAGGAVVAGLLVAIGLGVRHNAREAEARRAANLLPPPPPPQKDVAAIAPSPDWFLKGGLLSGGFVPPQAQADWPEWMQALLGTKADPASGALGRVEFSKIPDALLAHAVDVMGQQKAFSLDLLRQISNIGYVADLETWRQARTEYQKRYLAAARLPVEDPATCTLVLTELTRSKAYAEVRQAIQNTPFPADAEQRASMLRMVDLEEGLTKPSPELVQNTALPAAERFNALQDLPKTAAGQELAASFKGTPYFANAVFLAVGRGWLPITDALVDEALKDGSQPRTEGAEFLVPSAERCSDLLWLRAAAELELGSKDEAAATAQTLLDQYPDSYYTGHALFLLSCLGKEAQGHHARLRLPSDLSLYTAGTTELTPAEPWPAPYDALAAKGRFDLILAQVDLKAQPKVFLKAAAEAGQLDLVSRYLAGEKAASPDTLGFLYPVQLAPVLEGIIQEEGMKDLLDPAFVLSVIKCESLFQPTASSGADASGLMQLLKPTFARMMGKKADVRDPLTNLHAGIRYFKQIVKTADLEGLPRDVRYAYILAGYHAGEGRAKAWRKTIEGNLGNRTGPEEAMRRVEAIPISSTRQYLTRVLGDCQVYEKRLPKP